MESQRPYLGRMTQPLPTMVPDSIIGLEEVGYAHVGSEDWFMYPILQPGSLIMIDESRNKIVNGGWTGELDRPIYFLEHRAGYACAWCYQSGDQIVLQPHPSSMCMPEVYMANEVSVLGQVTGVVMRVGQAGLAASGEKERILDQRRPLLEARFSGNLSPTEAVRLDELDRALAAIELKEADAFDAQYPASRAGQIEAALDRVEHYLQELKVRSR